MNNPHDREPTDRPNPPADKAGLSDTPNDLTVTAYRFYEQSARPMPPDDAMFLDGRPLKTDNILTRMFEPEPFDARLRFRVGDRVTLSRPDLFWGTPVGCIGVVMELEPPDSAMSSKGRHYLVKFDLTPYKIPAPESITKAVMESPHLSDADKAAFAATPYLQSTSFNVSCLDIRMVAPGNNWNPDYKHPYDIDAIAEASINMTDDEFKRQLLSILENIGITPKPPTDSE